MQAISLPLFKQGVNVLFQTTQSNGVVVTVTDEVCLAPGVAVVA